MVFSVCTDLEVILAIVGGLILLVNMGPGMLFPCLLPVPFLHLIIGGLSVDEKKKNF